MADLQDLDRRRAQRYGDVALRVGGEQGVDAAVGREQDRGVVVRVVCRGGLALGPQEPEPEAAEPVALARPRYGDRDTPLARRSKRALAERVREGQRRLEDKPDVQALDHLGSSADVVPGRVREHEQVEPADAERAQLIGDAGLRRPLVHEHRRAGHLQERGVALANVEDRDAQAVRRRRCVLGPAPPRDEKHEGERADGDRPRPSRRLQPKQDCDEERRAGKGGERPRRRHLSVGKTADGASAPPEVSGQPAVCPRERGGGLGEQRVERRSGQRPAEQRRDDGRRERVRRHGVERNRSEMEPQDRRSHGAACSGDGDDLGQAAWQRVALEPAPEPRHEDEDRRHRRERELEARLQQRVRVPGEEHDGAHEEEVPALPRARREPRQRGERAGDSRAHDRGLPSDREHVPADRREGADLAEPTREAQRPGEQQHPADHVGDVLT